MKLLIADGPFTNVTVNNQTETYKILTTNGKFTFRDPNETVKYYTLSNIHMHSPSEHTFDGKHYDLEVHLVHTSSESGRYGVLALFFDKEEGGEEDNPFIEALSIGKYTSKTSWNNTTLPLEDEIFDLDLEEIFYYKGSLTTYPCSEVVDWFVIDSPLPISEK